MGSAIDSPEFSLVLACLRWPVEAVDGDRIRWLVRQPLRWPHLLEIVHHHKVVPLFSRNLNAFAGGYIPDEPADALRTSTVTNAHNCLQRTADLFSLNRLFREREIELRIFKGIPLAITAFQDPTLRDAGDIDLLVAENDIFRAEEILRAEGYLRFDPQARLTPRRLRSYFTHQKDFSYEHPESGAVIDLHWRLFRNQWLPANARLEQVGEDWVNLGSERIATLPAPQLLFYLCVHGALDGWLRLKWLADIAALLRTMTAQQLDEAAAAAARQQALPQFSTALLLCQDLLGYDPAGLEHLDRHQPVVEHLLRFSKRLMTSNQYRPVREAIPSSEYFLNEFRLHSSLRYRVDLIQRSLFRPRAWQRFDLPDALFPLYVLLSPLDWLIFHLHHRSAMLSHGIRAKVARWLPRRQRSPSWRILFRRITQLAPRDIALAAEAACMLTFFRFALNLLPVQRLVAWMGRESVKRSPSPAKSIDTIRRVEWAIGAIVRHGPLTFVCFPQCLAAYFMLRRRQIASRLFYGVARNAEQLKAHTWVRVGDRTVVGGEVESQFTVLNTFP